MRHQNITNTIGELLDDEMHHVNVIHQQEIIARVPNKTKGKEPMCFEGTLHY